MPPGSGDTAGGSGQFAAAPSFDAWRCENQKVITMRQERAWAPTLPVAMCAGPSRLPEHQHELPLIRAGA